MPVRPTGGLRLRVIAAVITGRSLTISSSSSRTALRISADKAAMVIDAAPLAAQALDAAPSLAPHHAVVPQSDAIGVHAMLLLPPPCLPPDVSRTGVARGRGLAVGPLSRCARSMASSA